MASTFTPHPAGGDYKQDKNGVLINERPFVGLLSLAGSDTCWSESVSQLEKFDLSQPAHGSLVESKGLSLLRMSPEQCMLYSDSQSNERFIEAATLLARQFATTDQADSWITLHISGANARLALRRICPLDISAQAFPAGSVRRTSMEHLAVIIASIIADEFIVFSPRSSANSFIHAIEESVENIG